MSPPHSRGGERKGAKEQKRSEAHPTFVPGEEGDPTKNRPMEKEKKKEKGRENVLVAVLPFAPPKKDRLGGRNQAVPDGSSSPNCGEKKIKGNTCCFDGRQAR